MSGTLVSCVDRPGRLARQDQRGTVTSEKEVTSSGFPDSRSGVTNDLKKCFLLNILSSFFYLFLFFPYHIVSGVLAGITQASN